MSKHQTKLFILFAERDKQVTQMKLFLSSEKNIFSTSDQNTFFQGFVTLLSSRTFIMKNIFIGPVMYLENYYRTSRGQFHQYFTSRFTRTDPKIEKKTGKLSSSIALLGSAHIKAARRMLVKLTPGKK